MPRFLLLYRSRLVKQKRSEGSVCLEYRIFDREIEILYSGRSLMVDISFLLGRVTSKEKEKRKCSYPVVTCNPFDKGTRK